MVFFSIKKVGPVCKSNGNCEITKMTRGTCSACRLKKCYELGMNNHSLRRWPSSNRPHPITDNQRSAFLLPKVCRFFSINLNVSFFSQLAGTHWSPSKRSFKFDNWWMELAFKYYSCVRWNQYHATYKPSSSSAIILTSETTLESIEINERIEIFSFRTATVLRVFAVLSKTLSYLASNTHPT